MIECNSVVKVSNSVSVHFQSALLTKIESTLMLHNKSEACYGLLYNNSPAFFNGNEH